MRDVGRTRKEFAFTLIIIQKTHDFSVGLAAQSPFGLTNQSARIDLVII